jgi:hypothetical protein
MNVNRAEQLVIDNADDLVCEAMGNAVGVVEGLMGEIFETDTSSSDFAGKQTNADILSERALAGAAFKLAQLCGRTVLVSGEELGTFVVDPGMPRDVRLPLKAKMSPEEITSADVVARFFLDGIDGSSNIGRIDEKGRSLPYGPIISLALGANPIYEDVLASAAVLASPDNRASVFAQREVGAFDTIGLRIDPIVMGHELQNDSLIYAEEVDLSKIKPGDALRKYWELNTEIAKKLQLTGLRTKRSGSTAADIIHVASGGSLRIGEILATVQATRGPKGNFELPTMYCVMRAVGGVMLALMMGTNGQWTIEEFADKSIVTYGHDSHIPFVAARSAAVAQNIVDRLNS